MTHIQDIVIVNIYMSDGALVLQFDIRTEAYSECSFYINKVDKAQSLKMIPLPVLEIKMYIILHLLTFHNSMDL